MSESKKDDSQKPLTDRQTLNVMFDTVYGPNIRRSDNLYQALAIVACLILGVALGALLMSDWRAGVFVGGFIGLLVGLFGSGIFLMVYRAISHARGRHD